jgi:hypothetical protein
MSSELIFFEVLESLVPRLDLTKGSSIPPDGSAELTLLTVRSLVEDALSLLSF